MRTVRPRAPAWVKLALVAVFVGGPGWWLADRHDRVGNESRMSAIATAIAGREVRVRCPGVVGRVLSWDIVEGSVRFDASGRPADETRLREFTCAELDALAEGRRASALTCTDAACAAAANDVALAVDVLAHESWHLAGVIDEAATECHAVRDARVDRRAARHDAGAGPRARAAVPGDRVSAAAAAVPRRVRRRGSRVALARCRRTSTALGGEVGVRGRSRESECRVRRPQPDKVDARVDSGRCGRGGHPLLPPSGVDVRPGAAAPLSRAG